MGTCSQQVAQRHHAHQPPFVATLDHGEACQAGRGHSLRHSPQGLVGMGNDRVAAQELLNRVGALPDGRLAQAADIGARQHAGQAVAIQDGIEALPVRSIGAETK